MAQNTHVIVFANEKGGTGKSTTAVHTAVALQSTGHSVAAIDLDTRQKTMTRYLDNREATARRRQIDLPSPRHVTTKLEGAEHDLLAYTAFPEAHWSKVWPNDPKEQLNRQLTRRTDVVQKFLNTESVICLVGALLIQVNDEMNSQSSAREPPDHPPHADHPEQSIVALPALPRT